MKIIKIIIAIGILVPTATYFINPFDTSSYDPRARIFGVVPYRIPSRSMVPTLQPGDFILVNATAYANKPPSTNDVVVFKYPKDRNINYVMRVIARSGETVSMSGGIVKVNGKPISQSYVNPKLNERSSTLNLTWEVPPGSLFVLGDNRDNSNDSRFWGFVPIKDVVGKVTIIWLSDNTDRIGKSVD